MMMLSHPENSSLWLDGCKWLQLYRISEEFHVECARLNTAHPRSNADEAVKEASAVVSENRIAGADGVQSRIKSKRKLREERQLSWAHITVGL